MPPPVRLPPPSKTRRTVDARCDVDGGDAAAEAEGRRRANAERCPPPRGFPTIAPRSDSINLGGGRAAVTPRVPSLGRDRMRPPPSISLHNRSFRWLVRSFLTMGSGGMRRTMPKDDVAVIRGEVAVHLAVARSLARSGIRARPAFTPSRP